jgi:outer membrane protein TolC
MSREEYLPSNFPSLPDSGKEQFIDPSVIFKDSDMQKIPVKIDLQTALSRRSFLKLTSGYAISLWLLLGGHMLPAQSLDSLLNQLPGANPELRALQLEYRAALQVAPQLSQMPDAELRLGWYALSPETRLGPQRLWWILNQRIPWPGKLKAEEELALAKAAPVLEQVAVQQLLLEQELKKAWLKLYQLNKQQEIIEDYLEIYDSWEQLNLVRIESNKATSVDVYKIELQKRELQQRRAVLEIEKAKPQAIINRLLNRPANTEISISGALGIPELPIDLESRLTRIGTDHPIIKNAELKKVVADRALALNKLDAKPDFTLGLDYFVVGQRVDADPAGNGRDILMPHIGMSIPLNKEKYRAKQQEEEIRIQALDARIENQLNVFRSIVETALAEYRRARSEVDFLDEQGYLLRTTIRVAQTDYANEKRPFDELLRLQDQLIGYRERHLASLVAMHLAMADLAFYLQL